VNSIGSMHQHRRMRRFSGTDRTFDEMDFGHVTVA
jgi:hypothetical protein